MKMIATEFVQSAVKVPVVKICESKQSCEVQDLICYSIFYHYHCCNSLLDDNNLGPN